MATKQVTNPLVVVKTAANENPFYGMRNTLSLFQSAGKGNVTESILSACKAEAKTKEQREMFYSLLFSIGD